MLVAVVYTRPGSHFTQEWFVLLRSEAPYVTQSTIEAKQKLLSLVSVKDVWHSVQVSDVGEIVLQFSISFARADSVKKWKFMMVFLFRINLFIISAI